MARIVPSISKLLAEKATDDILRASAKPRPFAAADFARPRASAVASDAAVIHTQGTPSAVAADIAYGPKPSLVKPKPSLEGPKPSLILPKPSLEVPKPYASADEAKPVPSAAADLYYPAADVYVPATDEAPSAFDRKKK